MESCWGVLMLLGVAAATTTSPPPPQQMLSYEEAVSLAIDLYNQGPDIDFAFRLLEAEAQPDWAATNETLQQLEFTVKETECPVSENLLLDQCDFRGNGVVRECSGTISTDPQAPLVLLTCDTVAQEHNRVRRSRFRKLRRKIKKGLKKGIRRLLAGGGRGPPRGGRPGMI
ncbi:cathelicidin-2-like [Macrochelys suwanniensis]